jgi:hypothetical protein
LAADTTTCRDLKSAAIPKDKIELKTGNSTMIIPAFENAIDIPPDPSLSAHTSPVSRIISTLRTFASFIGPGFLISVAYIDPGNYATDVAAGASTKFSLLFVVLMSNLFAIFLQSLSIKLGSVTGLNLAENCKMHAPKWFTIVLYVFSEVAIVATDIAEVWWLDLRVYVDANEDMVLGHWLGDCAESAVACSTCGGVCDYHPRCASHLVVLQTRRVDGCNSCV